LGWGLILRNEVEDKDEDKKQSVPAGRIAELDSFLLRRILLKPVMSDFERC